MLHAFRALCSSRRIHRRISAADDDDILTDIKISILRLEVRKEFKRIDRFAFFQFQDTRPGSADCKDDCCISCIFQHIQICDLCVQTDIHAHFLKERRIFVDGAVGDTESGDHVTYYSSESICLLEQRRLHTCTAEEICRSHSRRPAADHSRFSALCHGRSCEAVCQGIISVFCRDQFHAADVDGLFIEVTGTFIHTRMRTDRSCNERKRVLLRDDFHRFFIFTCFYKL